MTHLPRSPARNHRSLSRRRLLGLGIAAAGAATLPAWARAARVPTRRLAFTHLHTGEELAVTYYAHGRYDADALGAINHLLRDFRTGDTCPIETALLDQLSLVHAALGSDAPFQVISGYRSPATNDMLRARSNGVAPAQPAHGRQGHRRQARRHPLAAPARGRGRTRTGRCGLLSEIRFRPPRCRPSASMVGRRVSAAKTPRTPITQRRREQ